MKRSELRNIIKEEIENILEVNPDGTISPDEEEREEELLYDVENRILELITYANDEADNIGGEFRGPGIRNRIKELFLKYISFRM
jgi:hypothetical protein